MGSFQFQENNHPHSKFSPNISQMIYQDGKLVFVDPLIQKVMEIDTEEIQSKNEFMQKINSINNKIHNNLINKRMAPFQYVSNGEEYFYNLYHNQTNVDNSVYDFYTLFEISNFISVEKQLKSYYNFEKLIRSISKRFTQPETDKIDDNIINTFEEIGTFTGVDRIFLFLVDENDSSIVIRTHEWQNQGVEPLGDSFMELKRTEFEWIDNQLQNQNIVVYGNINSMSPEANKVKKKLIRFGIKSIILVPLSTEEELIGFLGLATINDYLQINEKMISSLEIVGEIIVNGLSRKFTEKKLLLSEERYINLMDHSPFGIGIHQDNKIVYANKAAIELLGAEKMEDVIGLSALSLISNAQKDFAAERVQKVYDFEIQEPVYYTFNRLDGKSIKVELLAIPIIYNGNVASQVLFRDVTQELEAQKIITDSEDKYRTLFETSLDPIFITSPNGKLIDANSAFIDLFGYEKSKLFNMNVVRLYYNPDDRLELIDKLGKENMVKNYELKLKHKNGSEIYVIASISAKTNENGEMIRFEGVFKNITEEKAAQEQLMQSEKLKSIGVLAKGMAHDFNNILTSIKGYTSMLLENLSEPKLRELGSKIIESTKDATILTSQLLAYAGIETDNKSEKISLKRELEDLRKFIKITIPSNLTINYSINETGMIIINKGQLSRIILSVLRNCYDTMEEKGGSINLTTGELSSELIDPKMFDTFKGVRKSNTNYSYVEIQDEGSGIPQHLIDQIFDSYFSTKYFGKGTGLASVWEVMQQYEGLIGVNSKLDYGTTVYLFLPQITKVSKESIEGDTRDSFKERKFHIRVILCDDEEIIRNVGRKLLEQLGCEVKLMSTGFELLRELEDNIEYDLIIIDLTMPNLSGIETIRRIRSRKIDIPIILTSGYPKDTVDDKYELYKINDFLSKPYDLTDLRNLFNKIFN